MKDKGIKLTPDRLDSKTGRTIVKGAWFHPVQLDYMIQAGAFQYSYDPNDCETVHFWSHDNRLVGTGYDGLTMRVHDSQASMFSANRVNHHIRYIHELARYKPALTEA